MAAEAFERTEAPTPLRRRQARRDGQVARSADLAAACVLLAALLLLQMAGPGLIAAFRQLLSSALSAPSGSTNFARDISPVIRPLVPLLAGLVIVAVVANVVQIGFLSRWKLNADALNPSKGWERIFSPRSRVRVLFDVIKLAGVGWIAWVLLRQNWERIIALQQVDMLAALSVGASIVCSIGLRVGALLLVLGILDFTYQRWQHERDLRMTPRELKDELRQMEGNPEIKRVRRGLLASMMPMRREANR